MRPLGVPTVLDRFIRLAVMQVLQERWEGSVSGASYGFRPARSVHQAIARAGANLRGLRHHGRPRPRNVLRRRRSRHLDGMDSRQPHGRPMHVRAHPRQFERGRAGGWPNRRGNATDPWALPTVIASDAGSHVRGTGEVGVPFRVLHLRLRCSRAVQAGGRGGHGEREHPSPVSDGSCYGQSQHEGDRPPRTQSFQGFSFPADRAINQRITPQALARFGGGRAS